MKSIVSKVRMGVSLAALSLMTAGALAQDFKLSSQWLENTVVSQTNRWWAEELDKRSQGKMKVKIFYVGTLAKPTENLQLIRSGGVELVNMSASYFGADLPLFTAPNSIPMAMADVGQATVLMQRLMTELPAMDEEAKRNGVKALHFHSLNPYRLVCKQQIKSIDDLKGKKIRSWGSDMPKMVLAAGAVPVTLFLPELYEGLQRGTIDCIPFSVDLMVSYKIHEVAKHVHDVTLWLGPTSGLWMARPAWDKLTPDQQKLFEQVSREAALRDRDTTIAAAATATETLKAAGVQFHAFPEGDKKKWKAQNPDFFADFVVAQEKAGRGDAARQMVKIWREVVQ